jgi:hypothetical protein
MRVSTWSYSQEQGWKPETGSRPDTANLILWFASPAAAADDAAYDALRRLFPEALIAGCSTGGQICDAEISSDEAVAAIISFDAAHARGAEAVLSRDGGEEDIGRKLASDLAAPDLKSVFVLSDGVRVNGTSLVQGLISALPQSVIVTGGLAGDGADFGVTRVGLNGPCADGRVVAIGLYGENLHVSWGSAGGWLPFGPERIISRSEKNVLYELDGQPALDIYKRYLGEAAKDLPGSALLFPLVIRPVAGDPLDIVRTIVGIDEKAKSLIFAGDVPQGWTGRLMRGAVDDLVDGAAKAAHQAVGAATMAPTENSLAILVSCIGRKLMMGQRTSDEVEAVRDIWGSIPTVGFYSYGEICPHGVTERCTLHNQTMTVTVLHEAG